MRLNSLSLLLAFAVSALALTVTSPRERERVDFSRPYTIRWSTVPSDPQNFTITLVNANSHNVNKDIAVDVDSSEEEYRVERIRDIPVGNNYQINIRSTARNNQGLLAQSPRFNVTRAADSADESESPSASGTSSESDAAPTETNAAVGNAKGAFVGSSVVVGVMGLVVLAL
ncbi:Ser-Thr-rich glycosyl-phosphatidyl-inositol-anchored membrane family-domain-containing protein [Aspergillus aurantiobrunneus]